MRKLRFLMRVQLGTSRILTKLLQNAVAKYFPHGENTHCLTIKL